MLPRKVVHRRRSFASGGPAPGPASLPALAPPPPLPLPLSLSLSMSLPLSLLLPLSLSLSLFVLPLAPLEWALPVLPELSLPVLTSAPEGEPGGAPESLLGEVVRDSSGENSVPPRWVSERGGLPGWCELSAPITPDPSLRQLPLRNAMTSSQLFRNLVSWSLVLGTRGERRGARGEGQEARGKTRGNI